MRTKRTNGTNTYEYVYNGGQLTRMVVNGENVDFTYAGGIPVTMTYQGATYFYVTNAQGDVIGLTDNEGNAIIGYYYEAYGKTYYITYDSTLAPVLSQVNPLCYRGYILDTGTGLYYCQSRYYDPVMGRWINADAFAATGQGLLGNNMFAYCVNNPVSGYDPTGNFAWVPLLIGAGSGAALGAISEWATGGSLIEIVDASLQGAVFGGIVVVYPSTAPYVAAAELGITYHDVVVKDGGSLEDGVLNCLVQWLFSKIPLPDVSDELTQNLVDFIFGAGLDLTSTCFTEITTSVYENFSHNNTQKTVPVRPPYSGGVGGGPDNTMHLRY